MQQYAQIMASACAKAIGVHSGVCLSLCMSRLYAAEAQWARACHDNMTASDHQTFEACISKKHCIMTPTIALYRSSFILALGSGLSETQS